MNTILPNKVIMASAGSGKTYQLVSRYITLLHFGVEPQAIVALTFTRKAAGEIFDRIMSRLAELIRDERKLSDFNAQINLSDPITKESCQRMLRNVISAMPMLRIGTLDSFMAQICGAYSFELGLQGGFQILTGYPQEVAQREALQQTMSVKQTSAELDAFTQAYKNSTYGDDPKRVSDCINEFIKKYYSTYLKAHDARYWGDQNTIWPDGSYWLDAEWLDDAKLQGLCDQLQGASDNAKWQEMIATFRSFDRDGFQQKGNKLLDRCFEQINELKSDSCSLKEGRGMITLEGVNLRALRSLMRFFMRSALETRMKKTAGIYGVLHGYEQMYSRSVRQTGKVTFEDLPLLLTGEFAQGHRGIKLSQENDGMNDTLLNISYRLDGKFDHWMLDEFQDTNRRQWSAMENLIDEVVQDNEGRRSFFYVGDIKQAIYGWRGGDSRLFGGIQHKYRHKIEVAALDQSRRSAPAVMEAVNHVFSNLPNDPELLPRNAVQRWQETWRTHQTAKTDMKGYCVLLEAILSAKEADEDPLHDLAVQQIATVRKNNPDASIGVLVRRSQDGREITDYMRSQGLDVAWEGDSPISDNTVVSSLLALLKLAEHPGDELAWKQVNMTPLKKVIPPRDSLSRKLQDQIHRTGFYGMIKSLAEACSASWMDASHECAFTRKRIEQLLNEAIAFDATGNKNALEFIQHIESLKTVDSALPGAVRVMTIHKSKGLEFDAVILPMFEKKKIGMDAISHGEVGLFAKEGNAPSDGEVVPPPEWVYYYPTKMFYEHDEILNDAINDKRADRAYESLCSLYVAMTRARQGLYILLPKPAENSKTFSQADLLRHGLAHSDSQRAGPMESGVKAQDINPALENLAHILYETGKSDWRLEKEIAAVQHVTPIAPRPPKNASARTRMERQIPSDDADKPQNAALLFAVGGRAAADFGTAIHALFEQMEGYGETDMEKSIAGWRETHPVPVPMRDLVIAQYRAAMKRPDAQRALSRPDANAEVWREKRFEIMLGTRWISGCFDRVTICRNEMGQPTSAMILDYKSNKVSNEDETRKATESYRSQLTLYRTVLSKILQLPEAAIRTELLFTVTGEVVEIT